MKKIVQIVFLLLTVCCDKHNKTIHENQKMNAIFGDIISAVELKDKCADSGDMDGHRFWLEIAAENGDCLSMVNFAHLLINSAISEEDYFRSSFWMNKAFGLTNDKKIIDHIELGRKIIKDKTEDKIKEMNKRDIEYVKFLNGDLDSTDTIIGNSNVFDVKLIKYAAQNGSQSGISKYAKYLAGSDDKMVRCRSLFWEKMLKHPTLGK